MQYKEAQQLREEWGNKQCDHPGIEKEYMLGAQTGDYVCTQCGINHPDKSSFRK